MTYSQAFYKTKNIDDLSLQSLNQIKSKKQTNRQTVKTEKKEHQRDTCWHDKVSHHAIVRWFYSQGGRHWSPQSCVGVHACMCVILHVPFCAWAEVGVEVCVCVCVRTYMKQATNEPELVSFCCCCFCLESWDHFRQHNVTALSGQCGGKAPFCFFFKRLIHPQIKHDWTHDLFYFRGIWTPRFFFFFFLQKASCPFDRRKKALLRLNNIQKRCVCVFFFFLVEMFQ